MTESALRTIAPGAYPGAAPAPSRRSFLSGASKAIAAFSIAAVPAVAAAQQLSEWDRLAASLCLIDGRLVDTCRHARDAGMQPKWVYSMVTVPHNAALLFQIPNGQLQVFNQNGETLRSAD